MEIEVTGLIINSNHSNSEPVHSHSLYLTTWNGRPVHKHPFSGLTTFEVGHDHKYAGSTEPAPSGVQHTHNYFTVTSFNDGHKHEIRGSTGPAIPLSGGGHFHKFKGVTTINGSHPHSHRYSGQTNPSD